MPDGQQIPATELDSSLARSRIVGISLSTTPERKTLASAFGAITLLDKSQLLDQLPPCSTVLSFRGGNIQHDDNPLPVRQISDGLVDRKW